MNQKRLIDYLIGAASWVSWKVRSNPTRFLFSDWLFKQIAKADSEEARFLNRRWLESGTGVIWDVGASLGKFTCDIARANPNCRVYAFEPNFNSIYFLAYRTYRLPNVEIVPAALTHDGRDIKGSYHPDFNRPATGPLSPSYSLAEAFKKFGIPAFIKMDIEGGEFDLFEHCADQLKGIHLLVEWHTFLNDRAIPRLAHWRSKEISPCHTYLEPLP